MKRLFCLLLFCVVSLDGTDALPRTIITIWDPNEDDDIWFTKQHQYMEMPLNHLGVKLEYHQLNDPLPDIKDRKDVLGVLSFLYKYSDYPDPRAFINWATEAINAGKKIVVMGNPGFYSEGIKLTPQELNSFWNLLGLADNGEWIRETYDIKFPILDKNVVEFERKLQDIRLGFHSLRQKSNELNVHLMARKGWDELTDSVLVCTNENGGYVCDGYASYAIFNTGETFRRWYLNPFSFFRKAFQIDDYPIPDTTTLNGRRMYYSHIDGDGWNSISHIYEYRRNRDICAEVVYRELIKPYPNLPVTVAPVAAELDISWFGTEKNLVAARSLFALPQVELSSHTYSHPFAWSFFEDYQPEDELPYLKNYRLKTWKGTTFWMQLNHLLAWDTEILGADVSITALKENEEEKEKLLEKYDIPRAYAVEPFTMEKEVQGSFQTIESQAPEGKKIQLFQWSGNCQPYEAILTELRRIGVPNLNGGDTRFDSEFYSYSWVRPLGRHVNQEQQIYASASNENTYTDLWRDRFYGFNQLPETFKNTNSPIRLKPMNVYYHMYSGEKLASLNAVKQNIEYVLAQPKISVDTSHFAVIVEGFYTAEFYPIGERTWIVKNRGRLQTIRFDRASMETVDYTKSKGVIGSRNELASLYVFLDPAEENVVIALKEMNALVGDRDVVKPYLIESSWLLWNVNHGEGNTISWDAKGYDVCEMRWKVPKDGNWKVTLDKEQKVVKSEIGELRFTIGKNAYEPVSMKLEYE